MENSKFNNAFTLEDGASSALACIANNEPVAVARNGFHQPMGREDIQVLEDGNNELAWDMVEIGVNAR